MKITLKDGSSKEYAQPMSVYEIALDISEGLARVATAGEIDTKVPLESEMRRCIPSHCISWRTVLCRSPKERGGGDDQSDISDMVRERQDIH